MYISRGYYKRVAFILPRASDFVATISKASDYSRWCLIEDIRYTKLAVCGPNMWQSWVEIEYYSVAQFDCITAFEAL